jgi:integrase
MNNQAINALKPGEYLWDDVVTGLQVRALATKKCFYLYYRANGTQRHPHLCDFPEVSISDARGIAREWLLAVARGRDPYLERQQLKAEATINDLFERVWRDHWSQARYKRSGHAREVMGLWHRYLHADMGKKRLSEVTAATVRAWHAAYSPTPYAANRALEVLSKMFSFAEEKEWRPQNSNPCRLVKGFKENPRDRYATPEEIEKLGRLLAKYEATHAREVAFIYLLAFTGSRPRAIERAKRSDLERFDSNGLAFGVLSIEGKTGPEKIYLPPQAMRVIEKIPLGETLLGIKMPRYFWARIRAEAGIKALWARDWRRTFATLGMGEGFEMSVISELLNHKSAQTTKTYAKLDDEKRKKVSCATAERVEKLMKGNSE